MTWILKYNTQNKGTLTKTWRDHGGQAHKHTHTETKSKYFDGHGCPSQSEESECMWAHD